MDVYRQAAEVVGKVRGGKGTAKNLCLQKEMQKKRQTYAVVCETLRHYEVLEAVLEQAEYFKFYPNHDPSLAMVLCYDTVVGSGVRTKQDKVAVAITESATYLQSAYSSLRPHYTIAPRVDTRLPDADEDIFVCPKYVRINTLQNTMEEATKILDKRLQKRVREEEHQTEEEEVDQAKVEALREYTVDAHIPNLIRFPPSSNIHAHPLVRYGKLVIQDKASCIPASVLMNSVTVVPAVEISKKPFEYVLDACAAPGNKTSQLAALGADSGIKLMALEKDARRYQTLVDRMKQLGATHLVNVVNDDFFNMQSNDREVVEALLLDPSCSASGVVSRVDVALAADKEDVDTSRVEKLAAVQRKMLCHALISFKNCRRVVYSTCSIHEEENENVVRQVLDDERVAGMKWTLSNIMPNNWKRRGWKKDDDKHPLDHTIRCDAKLDATSGFYVACFDRIIE
jgi:putative methyltransferase